MFDRTTLSLTPLHLARGGEVEPVAVGLTLMWHPDIERVGDRLTFAEDTVQISRLEPEFFTACGRSSGPLSDPYVSRSPLVFVRLDQGFLIRGRAVVDGRELDGERLFTQTEIKSGVTVELAGRIVLLLHRLPVVHRVVDDFGLVGDSVPMRRLRRDIEEAAASEASVLIRGETGVGKELVARALHRCSTRSAGPFLAVNVTAIPPLVAASAFFGHLRGSFSGAERARAGYFASAATGTLFLDEIGDLPAEMQPMLLRALQFGEIQPVGGQGPRQVDVRVIAATDADLEGTAFSRPLLYRLAAIELEVPPLRARRGDITRLLLWGLRRELGVLGALERLDEQRHQGHLWLDASTIGLLCRYSWPGNVRELLSVARQIVLAGRRRAQVRLAHVSVLGQISRRVVGPSSQAAKSHVPAAELPVRKTQAADDTRPPAAAAVLSREVVVDALRDARWSVSAAARTLGVARTTLYRWAKQHGLARTSAEISDSEVRAAWIATGGDRDAMVDSLRLSPRSLATRINTLGLGAPRNGTATHSE